MADYLDWKRIAATRSHFETLVSLINYHLVPRVSQIPAEDFNGRHFYDLAMDVIETPPKMGQKTPGPRVPIQRLSEDELRRRKKTLNALISILRGAFDIAWERGALHTDRPKRCLRRVPKVDRPRVIFLDRTECRLLIGACHPDLKTLVRAALYTGCRANELIQMRVGDVSDRMNSVFISSPKGRRSRHVFLPSEGVVFFRALANGRLSSDRLFRKENGRIWGGEYKSYFQAARGQARLPASLTFHRLRHTYASQLVQSGASLMIVAEQLGHANTQTVSATYGHLVTQHRESEIERCFEPLASPNSQKLPDCLATKAESPSDRSDLPRFIHREVTSWPRSNFSRLSGPLLQELRNSR
ncbi:MAG: site-specific integrase [Paracoccaceae bacterium]|nr:site-specific integrase [Paracoccaceae bacterium]